MKYLDYSEQNKKQVKKVGFLTNIKKTCKSYLTSWITVIFLGGWSHGIIFLRWSLGMVYFLEMVLLVHKK